MVGGGCLLRRLTRLHASSLARKRQRRARVSCYASTSPGKTPSASLVEIFNRACTSRYAHNKRVRAIEACRADKSVPRLREMETPPTPARGRLAAITRLRGAGRSAPVKKRSEREGGWGCPRSGHPRPTDQRRKIRLR